MVNFLWDNFFKKSDGNNFAYKHLKENFIFEDLSRHELKFVEEMIHVRNFQPGEVVFKQGEVGVGMYIIAEGSVDIFVEELKSQPEDPAGLFVTRLNNGDFFGELSLVEVNGRRTATARSSNDTILIGFFKPDLIEISERNPSTGVKIALKIAEVLGRRLKETSSKVSQLKQKIQPLEEKGI